MKRKQKESIIRLAFGEYSSEAERKSLEAGLPPEGSERELDLVASIRDGLKQMGANTPECQVSVDRIRDAILSQNIRETRGFSGFWQWASVGVAACALLFVFNTNRNAPAEPRLVAGDAVPSIIQEDNPLLNEPESSRVATMWEAASPVASVPVAEVKRGQNSRTAYAPQGPGKAAETKKFQDGRPSVPPVAAASRRDALRNAREAAFTMSAAVSPGLVDSPEDEPSEPIILINSDTDSDTGAQVATEVESVENVPIGG